VKTNKQKHNVGPDSSWPPPIDRPGEAASNGQQLQISDLLNAYHRRTLATVLRRVELAAWRLEDQITRGVVPQLTLTRFTNPPGVEQQAALLQLIRQVRQEVAELASDCHLQVSEENLSRTILAEFSLLWCDLEDARPKKLRAYGALNPQADDLLGPRIQRLIELMLEISQVAGNQQSDLLTKQENDESNAKG